MATKVTVTGIDSEGWDIFGDVLPPYQTLIQIDNGDGVYDLAVRTGGTTLWIWDSDGHMRHEGVFTGSSRWRLARPGQSVLIEAVAD